jgi:hypothetical protein
MVIHRTNLRSNGSNGSAQSARQATADECYRVMERHAQAQRKSAGAPPASPAAPPPSAPPPSGDIIYGARAIARFIFGEDGNRARRRVFNLWAHYQGRDEAAGFFKLKGAVCLSKSKWTRFHGLG